MKVWKIADNERKGKNNTIKARYQVRLTEWEEERGQAKFETRKPGWKKPTRGKLLPPIPKPKARPEANNGDEDSESSSDDNQQDDE
jgi:hypothetical protein